MFRMRPFQYLLPLLLCACASPQRAPSGEPELREAPSRLDMMRAMGSIRARVRECVGSRDVSVFIRVELRGDGSVTSASACGAYGDGTDIDLNSTPPCLVDAARALRVDPFGRPTFTVRYPFAFGDHAVEMPAHCAVQMPADMDFSLPRE